MAEPGDDRAARREFLYREFDATLDILKTFYEWRHRIMTRFAVVVSGIFVSLRWVQTPRVRAALFVVGCALSLGAFLLDRINSSFIDRCNKLGASIESELGHAPAGPVDGRPTAKAPWLFGELDRRGDLIRYRTVLGAVYLATAAAFLVLAVGTWRGWSAIAMS